MAHKARGRYLKAVMQSPPAPRRPEHKTPLVRRRAAYFFRLLTDRRPGFRAQPAVARFPAATAGAPSPADGGRPPVRIYIGTEPGQARAERVLVWSILARRDPTRAYEIHLMADLAGFERRFWKTGFTNYRYAIPAFAGGVGRAIYNDADQIYLADPALLFDLDMAGAGAMSVDGRDTSVMLLDCRAMAEAWPPDPARAGKPRHADYRARRDARDLWGPLDPGWNARDAAYDPATTRLLHFTTLHRQPWRPFARELRYAPHPHADVWNALERDADAAGFTIFTAERPSPAYAAAARAPIPAADPAGLHAFPEHDVPWLLDRLFSAAGTCVDVEVACYKTPELAAADPATLTLLPPAWWRMQLEAASRRRPGVAWRLTCRRGRWAPAWRAQGQE